MKKNHRRRKWKALRPFTTTNTIQVKECPGGEIMTIESTNISKKTNDTSIIPITASKKEEPKPLPKHTGCSNKHFEFICKLSQRSLKGFCIAILREAGYHPIAGDGYIYAKGDIPILLTAHMDTVHDELPTIIVEKKVEDKTGKVWTGVTSPFGIGGDDRCGVYMILEVIRTTKLRPTIVFCEDEEIGGVGSRKFVQTELANEMKDLYYMIELDRANDKDAVFYDCDNPEFTSYITENTGYEKTWGSFSDISVLAPFAGIAAVNLSCGYYNAHTNDEFVILEQMDATLQTVIYLLTCANENAVGAKRYEYIKKKYSYNSSRIYGRYCDFDEDDWYEYYRQKYGNKSTSKSYSTTGLDEEKPVSKVEVEEDTQYFDADIRVEVTFLDPITMETEYGYGAGITKMGALGDCLMKNPQYCFNDVLDYDFF